MSVKQEAVPVAVPVPEPSKPAPSLRPSLLEEVFAASTPTNMDAMGSRDLFRKRRVTFLMPREYCTVPFPEDFELTLAELDAATDMECMRSATTGQELGVLYAKASMHGLNGKPITTVHRDWLWNALGMAGRQMVVNVFAVHLAPNGDEEGKARMDAAILGARVE